MHVKEQSANESHSHTIEGAVTGGRVPVTVEDVRAMGAASSRFIHTRRVENTGGQR